MRFALETAQFGLAYAAKQLDRKGTPKAKKLAKVLRSAEAGINEYLSTPDDGK